MSISLTHGAAFIALKTTGLMRDHAHRMARRLSLVTTIAVVVFVVWTRASSTKGGFPSVVEIVAVVAAATSVWLIAARRDGVGIRRHHGHHGRRGGVLVLRIRIPRVMVSTLGTANDLTVTNTSSAPYSLKVMTVVAAVMVPAVLVYQGWTYYVFRQRVSRSPVA